MDDTNGGSTSLGSNNNIFMGYDRWWNLGRYSNYNVGIGNYVMDGVLDEGTNNVGIGHQKQVRNNWCKLLESVVIHSMK